MGKSRLNTAALSEEYAIELAALRQKFSTLDADCNRKFAAELVRAAECILIENNLSKAKRIVNSSIDWLDEQTSHQGDD
jgi:hypothetical protein